MWPPKEVTKRWLNIIGDSSSIVQHIKGKNTILVDYLSRKGSSLQERPLDSYNNEAPQRIRAINYNIPTISEPPENSLDEQSNNDEEELINEDETNSTNFQ